MNKNINNDGTLDAYATSGTSPTGTPKRDLSVDRLLRKAKAATRPYKSTDLGNAERLVDLYGSRLRFRFERTGGRWHAWDGKRWALDTRGEAERCAKGTVRAIYEDALLLEGDARAALMKWAIQSENVARLDAMLKAARSDERIVVSLNELGARPWALNVENGIVNLRTGALRDHDPAELHSKMANASLPDEGWRQAAPGWQAFLDRIFPDPEVQGYVQKLAGYSMAGVVGENVLPFAYGSGANGKSVFLSVLRHVLGDYATEAAPDLLVARRERGIPTDVADLRGYRLVTTTEVEGGRAMATDLMKRITGEDTIKARKMRQDFEEFPNVTTLWMAGNDRPQVDGLDPAIWRRMRLIPFGVTIPAEERDPDLAAKLREQRNGVLGWLVEGIVRYHADKDAGGQGLRSPEAVKKATEEYQQESNPLADWFEAKCEADANGWVSAQALRQSYEAWANFTRVRRVPRGKKWKKGLEDLGCAEDRKASQRGFRGVRLRQTNDGMGFS